MKKFITILFVSVFVLMASRSVLAQTSLVKPCPGNPEQSCVFHDCTVIPAGVYCKTFAPLASATSTALPTTTTAAAPILPTTALQCAGNACVDPNAGKFCGIHWCVWLVLLFLVALTLIIMWWVQRQRAAYWSGKVKGALGEWNLLRAMGATRDELVAAWKRVTETEGMLNSVLQPFRMLHLMPTSPTHPSPEVTPTALPNMPPGGGGAPGAAAAAPAPAPAPAP